MQLRKKLEQEGYQVVGTLHEFDGSNDNGLWLSNEGYSNLETDENFDKIVEAGGCFWELYDGGTMMIYEA